MSYILHEMNPPKKHDSLIQCWLNLGLPLEFCVPHPCVYLYSIYIKLYIYVMIINVIKSVLPCYESVLIIDLIE